MGDPETSGGGGAVIEVTLPPRVNVGNLLLGKVTLTAGPERLILVSLVAHLSSVELHIPRGSQSAEPGLFRILSSPIPRISSVPAGQSKTFKFKIHIPDDLDPAGTYKVLIRAELMSADPIISISNLRVLAPGVSVDDPEPISEEEAEVLARYPDLRSPDPDAVRSALHALARDMLSHPHIIAALQRLAGHSDPEIRKAVAALVLPDEPAHRG